MFAHQRNCCEFSKRIILIAICCVLLSFVQESCQFTFNFGGGSSGDSEEERQSVTSTAKLTKKGRGAVSKFKFRKIERVYTNDESADDNVNNEAANSKDTASGADDDSKAQSAEADNSRMNEDEEAIFEQSRKVHKKLNSNKKANKPRKSKKYTDDDDEDDDDYIKSTEPETTMFTALYDKFFGAKEEISVEEDDDKNSIITWLKWLGERSGRLTEPTSEETVSSESWTNYLNRWPFNSLFPMDSTKKRTKTAKKAAAEKKVQQSEEVQPMSQEQFETLLHTLPAFVLSPTNVDDIDCRRQLQIFQRQLRGNKMWTLQSTIFN